MLQNDCTSDEVFAITYERNMMMFMALLLMVGVLIYFMIMM